MSVKIGSLDCSSSTARVRAVRARDRHGGRDDRVSGAGASVPCGRAAARERAQRRRGRDPAGRPLGGIRRIGALQSESQQVGEHAVARGIDDRGRDAARVREHPTIGIEHAEASARAAERREQRAELRALIHEAPGRAARRVPSGRESDGVVGARAVDSDHPYSQARADERERNAHLDLVAARRSLPRTDDAIVVVVARLETFRLRLLRAERARRARREQQPAHRTRRRLDREHDSIAVRRLPELASVDDVGVAHRDEKIREPPVHAREHASVRQRDPGVIRDAPVVVHAVEARLSGERRGVDRGAASGRVVVHARRRLAERRGLLLERRGDRRRACDQRLLEPAAQRGFHLLNVAKRGPGQDQRHEAEHEQLDPERHGVAAQPARALVSLGLVFHLAELDDTLALDRHRLLDTARQRDLAVDLVVELVTGPRVQRCSSENDGSVSPGTSTLTVC